MVLDIVVVAIIGLFAIVGLFRGLFKSILSLFGSLLAIVVAVLFAQKLATIIGGMFGLSTLIENGISGMLAKSDVFAVSLPTDSVEVLTEALGGVGIPAILGKYIAQAIMAAIPDGTLTISLVDYLAPILANVVLVVIAFILLFIVISIIMKILEKIFNKLLKSQIINSIDKVLGFIFGLAKGYLLVSLLLMLVSFLSPMSLMQPLVEMIDQSTVFKLLYENNWIKSFLATQIDFGKLLSALPIS